MKWLKFIYGEWKDFASAEKISRKGAKVRRNDFSQRRKDAKEYFHAMTQRCRGMISRKDAKMQRNDFSQRRKDAEE